MPSPAYSEQDHHWMQRALSLAENGAALCSPNPIVGCVILDRHGSLAGEGWHEYDRRDHAEIAALRHAGARAAAGTAYVTLEPCNHTGRTGPCSQALIAAGVSRVVAATTDPNPQVAGSGLERLRQAGIAVQSGLLQTEARRLNEGFARWIVAHRPFVLMKVAMTLDGRISPSPGSHPKGQPYWITGEASRAAVQALRWQSDAILTGVDTVLADNPQLTDRSGKPRRRPLLRVVLDSALRIPLDSQLVASAASSANDVLLFTVAPSAPGSQAASLAQAKTEALLRRGVRVVELPSHTGRVPPDLVLEHLGAEGILTLLTETGTRLNTALLAAGLVDRIQLFCSPQILGSDAVPAFHSLSPSIHLDRLGPPEIQPIGSDFSLTALLRDPWPS
jgi:diaminohydroxyphosphoribosylaminopyrimidine deaminase/5-amino-6-(5-phosphoribosylamino)uracil reductase